MTDDATRRWAEANKRIAVLLLNEQDRELADLQAKFDALAEQLRELQEAVKKELPEHGGTCDGDDAKPLPYDRRGLENPCLRCRVLRTLARGGT